MRDLLNALATLVKKLFANAEDVAFVAVFLGVVAGLALMSAFGARRASLALGTLSVAGLVTYLVSMMATSLVTELAPPSDQPTR